MDLGKDFKIDVTRGSGPGGQHKNKVETCVKITYIPLNISETCQETRSKLRNYEIAKTRIFARIKAIKEEKKKAEINEQRKEQISSRRVRTYNFKTGIAHDHITGKKAPLNKVLDGNLDLLK